MPDTFLSAFPPILHPSATATAVASVEAGVRFTTAHVVFHFCVRGDMARLRVPSSSDPTRSDMLWEHTCFEAFVCSRGEKAYREFNFSPSGQWAVYDFSDYRHRLTEDPAIDPPLISVQSTDGRLEVKAIVPISSLPHASKKTGWEIGLSAVIESADTIDGDRSYWALHHPSPRPDFHHRGGFRLKQDAKGISALDWSDSR